MNILIIVLRLIHILSGVFWVGSSIMLAAYIAPTVAATGESGQKFMAHIVTKAKVSVAISAAAGVTVLAGGFLYWIDSQGLTSPWQHSGPGIGFGIGGLAALVGLAFGGIVGRSTNVLGRVAGEIQGKPTPEQMGRIQSAQRQLAYAVPIGNIALIVALICMASARYWLF